jgi:hypothetical protein
MFMFISSWMVMSRLRFIAISEFIESCAASIGAWAAASFVRIFNASGWTTLPRASDGS